MYSEQFYEGFHYVKDEQDTEPIEREIAPLEERIIDQNLWQGVDWGYYYQGQRDGELGFSCHCSDPFYQLGHETAQEKYRK